MYVVSEGDLRFLADSSTAPATPILLKPPKDAPATASKENVNQKSLGGFPGEIVAVGSDRLAMTVRNLRGETSKVALIDRNSGKLYKVVTTGRGSVKFGKIAGMMALSVAMTAASYQAGYYTAQSIGSPFFTYNVYSFSPAPPNIELHASSDGTHLYALNTFSRDVTVIKASDGSIVDKVPFGGQWLEPAGKDRLMGWTGQQMQFLDTQGNKKIPGPKSESGKIEVVSVGKIRRPDPGCHSEVADDCEFRNWRSAGNRGGSVGAEAESFSRASNWKTRPSSRFLDLRLHCLPLSRLSASQEAESFQTPANRRVTDLLRFTGQRAGARAGSPSAIACRAACRKRQACATRPINFPPRRRATPGEISPPRPAPASRDGRRPIRWWRAARRLLPSLRRASGRAAGASAGLARRPRGGFPHGCWSNSANGRWRDNRRLVNHGEHVLGNEAGSPSWARFRLGAPRTKCPRQRQSLFKPAD